MAFALPELMVEVITRGGVAFVTPFVPHGSASRRSLRHAQAAGTIGHLRRLLVSGALDGAPPRGDHCHRNTAHVAQRVVSGMAPVPNAYGPQPSSYWARWPVFGII